MRRLIYSARAEESLGDIALYIAQESGDRSAADAFDAKLRAKCRHLASLPGQLGTPRPELGEQVRSMPFQNYVIFFRYREAALEIITIMESHRDILAQFDTGNPAT